MKRPSNDLLLHALTVVFVTLKLFGVITWSWWLVLLPSLLVVGASVLVIGLLVLLVLRFSE